MKTCLKKTSILFYVFRGGQKKKKKRKKKKKKEKKRKEMSVPRLSDCLFHYLMLLVFLGFLFEFSNKKTY